MAKQFDSIQTLLKQVHGDAPGESAFEEGLSSEEKALANVVKFKAAIEKFKADVLADKAVNKRLQKFRHEGVYAVRAWQWALIVIGAPFLIFLVFYGIHMASSVTRANIAIRNGIRQIYADDITGAFVSLDKAISLGAEPGSTLLRFGAALADKGLVDTAIRTYDRAALAAIESNDFSVQTAAAINAAEILFEEGRLDDAALRIKPILEGDAKQRDALIMRGRIFLALSRYSEAEAAFNSSLERNSTSLTPRYYLRETYLRNGNVVAAREQEDFLLHARPAGDEDVPTLVGYADLLVREGSLREAEDVLLSIISKQRKPMPEIMVSLGHLAIENKDMLKAAAYADSAIAIAPDAADGYVLHAEIAYNSGKGREAIKDLDKALSLDPLNAKALYDMGCILFYDLGMNAQALQYFQKAVDQGFDGPFVWYNIGATRYLTNDFHGATEAYVNLPDFVKSSSDVKWAQANAYLRDRQIDTALLIFKELRNVREKDPALDNNLGIAYELHGDTIDAQRQYWTAVQTVGGDTPKDTVAMKNINRVLMGRAIDQIAPMMHRDIPLRLRGITLPKQVRQSH